MFSYIERRVITLISLALCSAAHAGAGAPSSLVHQVSIGDSLPSIAKRYTGEPKNTNEIIELNPDLENTGLKVGQTIYVPNKPSRQANNSLQNNIKLPPKPNVPTYSFERVKGAQEGLAHSYINGKFMTISAPIVEALKHD